MTGPKFFPFSSSSRCKVNPSFSDICKSFLQLVTLLLSPCGYRPLYYAAAKSFQSCPTLRDPIDGSPPGPPPSLGLSRQEHWSGLPLPSPTHESEKWKWNRSVQYDSSRPHGLQPNRLLHPWDLPGKSTGVGCHCLLLFILLILNIRLSLCIFSALVSVFNYT